MAVALKVSELVILRLAKENGVSIDEVSKMIDEAGEQVSALLDGSVH